MTLLLHNHSSYPRRQDEPPPGALVTAGTPDLERALIDAAVRQQEQAGRDAPVAAAGADKLLALNLEVRRE